MKKQKSLSIKLDGQERELLILGSIWKVEFGVRGLATGGGMVYGLCDHDQHQIRIAGEICREVRRKTVLHEVLHAIIQEVGVGRNGDDPSEESYVRAVETGIYQVMREPYNNWLAEFFFEEESENG
jgi:hypothetical protein